MSTIVYLHGFASSPYGHKATIIRERCAAIGVGFHAPDLNVPSFEQMTISAGIKAAASAIAACEPPVHLIGSSLGGLTALHLLEQHTLPVEHLLLLAPGLGLVERWAAADLEAWQRADALEVYHYGRDAWAAIHYGFFEDAVRYDGFSVRPPVPTLIIHGRHDDVVPVGGSQRFADLHPGVRLLIVESDHGLTDRVDLIWENARRFFGV